MMQGLLHRSDLDRSRTETGRKELGLMCNLCTSLLVRRQGRRVREKEGEKKRKQAQTEAEKRIKGKPEGT